MALSGTVKGEEHFKKKVYSMLEVVPFLHMGMYLKSPPRMCH